MATWRSKPIAKLFSPALQPSAGRQSETSFSTTASSTPMPWCACGSISPVGPPLPLRERSDRRAAAIRVRGGVACFEGGDLKPMPKRPDALETLRLALELLRRIPRKRKVTALELHAQLL